jgi:hypothetical protein
MMDIPRDVPTPKPTPNELLHRLDAEAEAFMKEHALGIINAWVTYKDPTIYPRWNEDAVRKNWPELWTRWRTMTQARDRMEALIGNEYDRRRPRPPAK